MNEGIMVEKKCPICEKEIRSDATVHEYCTLCGMGIPEPYKMPWLQIKDRMAYFCCDRCLSIYKKNVLKKRKN